MGLRRFALIIVAIVGLGSFLTAVIYLTRGHDAEWITLVLAPISGLCLSVVMKQGKNYF